MALLLMAACTARPLPPQPVRASSTLSATPAGIWRPVPGDTFQLQFAEPIDPSINAGIYDIDLFDNEAAAIANLHAEGKKVICYINVGAWEDWRPDADQFPRKVIGKTYAGWPGEKWLDIRQIDTLAPIMRARLDMCAAKGFDGVEPDNIEAYDNESGFPLTYQDQLRYATWLADEAHARGLAIGLKNAPDMVADALPYFDFSVVEDCFYYSWCADMLPFLQAGKPVFAIEYTDMKVNFVAACAKAKALGLSMLLKHRNLDAYRQACP